jgi:hypothetical protein
MRKHIRELGRKSEVHKAKKRAFQAEIKNVLETAEETGKCYWIQQQGF